MTSTAANTGSTRKEDMKSYLHQVPGRLRIKTPVLKRAPWMASDVVNLFNHVRGVTSCSVNTVTGSVVVNYRSDMISPQSIIRLLDKEGFVDMRNVVSVNVNDDATYSRLSVEASKILLGLFLDRTLAGTPFSLLTALI
jgi:hypothetical protein